MRIGVFTYDFPHFKTQQGLTALMIAGFKPAVILAQEKKALPFISSKIDVLGSQPFAFTAKQIARHFGIEYCEVDHDSVKARTIVLQRELDLGVILGARILKKQTILGFGIGIINAHPGLLPLNRGLDNLKWAVWRLIKQGVTTHLIDTRIDQGMLIERREINVVVEDSLASIAVRLGDLQIRMIVEAVSGFVEGAETPRESIEGGTLHKSMPPKVEAQLAGRLEYYKRYYKSWPGGDNETEGVV